MRVRILETVTQLRRHAPAWDDLWQRSSVTQPTARAELVAHWVDHFAPRTDFRVILVEDGGQLVAALPLVKHIVARVLQCGVLPGNDYSPAGDLLMDASGDVEVALDLMLAALVDLPWHLIRVEGYHDPHGPWVRLRDAAYARALICDQSASFDVGLIPTHGDWSQFRRSWSKNYRRKMGQCRRRLAQIGTVELKLFDGTNVELLKQQMHVGLQVEDRNWKGRDGTSVLKTPSLQEYYLHQIDRLSLCNQALVALLMVGDQPAAFEYGWNAKGVYHSLKVGYDEAFAKYSPGQLLMHELLELWFSRPDGVAMNCLGPLNAAVSRWRPQQLPVGRLMLSTNRFGSRSLVSAYKRIWHPLRDRGLESRELASTSPA